ncbi:MAG: M20/M25/M40 family metallo-hydrolase [Armatimonadetes bacterium]|nr:M20/M25/M40 family metallo-hydrolase [Armatimonadota bacterium]
MGSAEIKQRALQEIDRTTDELVALCSQIVQLEAENPPGDTTRAADFFESLFKRHGLPADRHEPQPAFVSLVSYIGDPKGRPHFVFNAHLDTFPAERPDLWAFPPYSGQVADGQVRGRGSADMRCGLTASLYAFLLLHRLKLPIKGRCTLMLVADEECGGHWGTGWLLRTYPELAGDACLIGEPESTQSLRIGEKGKSQLKLVARGESYHAGLATADDVNVRMGAALQIMKELVEVRGEWPADMKEVIEFAKGYSRYNRDKGKGWLLEHTAVNVGVVRGGVKINIVPMACEAEVDVRIPYGVKPADMKAMVERRLKEAGLGSISVEHIQPTFEASYTSPSHPFVTLVKENVKAITGNDPPLTVSFAATDARYFRPRGVPALIFGPRPNNIAGLNEYITIEDLVTVTKVHTTSAIDFLCA